MTMMATTLAVEAGWITDGLARDTANTKLGQNTFPSLRATNATASHPQQASAMAVIMDCIMPMANGREMSTVLEVNKVGHARKFCPILQ